MRRFFRKLHKWLSIPVGIIITIVCLSGAILVFQEEILELANPSHYFVNEVKGDPIPLNELISIVNAQLTNNSVENVRISSNKGRTYTMGLSEGFRISAFVDQYTGKVVGIYKTKESPFFTIMSLHRWLMDGSRTWGKYTVGISTLVFVFILISGFIIWFPRKKKKGTFKIHLRKGRKRLLYDLHSVLGVYACLLLLVCALTGLMWSFDWYRNAVFSVFGAKAVKENKKEEGKNHKSKELNIAYWQAVFDSVSTSNPDYDYIRLSGKEAAVHLNTATLSRNTDKYIFDAETGRITKIILFGDQEATTRISAWLYSLHVGNYWGVYSKIFTCLAALIGASLPITGYYMYLSKKKRKARK